MTDFSAGRVGTCLTAAPGATGACKPSDGSRVRDLCGVRDAHVEQRIAERPDGLPMAWSLFEDSQAGVTASRNATYLVRGTSELLREPDSLPMPPSHALP